VISVRALVVYESMYGNTRGIAGNIADGLRSTCEVTLVPVAEATAELVPARAHLRIAKVR
jgi:menaquinone-dependent protoporphyrinogen IX oxidase